LIQLIFSVNHQPVNLSINEDTTLLTVLRDQLGLTGTKAGCQTGHCGTCSILVDDNLVKACQMPARLMNGKEVTTIEGIHDPDGQPNDVQLALLKHGAIQCGYCIPAMVLAAEALLRRNLNPNRMEIRQAITGVLCRCTGYQQIIDAIQEAAAQRRNTQLSKPHYSAVEQHSR
jgi:aerobic carbon-monoxide dehydrogenase small subunit